MVRVCIGEQKCLKVLLLVCHGQISRKVSQDTVVDFNKIENILGCYVTYT